jgi:2-amino-4-hydroxy-6-hydroxymethyldihydropteridine diphosphokinase
MLDCLISFGSNLGDGNSTFTQALGALEANDQLSHLRHSRLHATLPIGGSSGQGNYVNAAIRCSTGLGPFELFKTLLALEAQLGRVRASRWGPRQIDLDLLLFGSQRVRLTIPGQAPLVVPHPRMSFRRFVLVPASEIAGDMPHPTARMTINQLLAHLSTAEKFVAVLSAADWATRACDAMAGQTRRSRAAQNELDLVPVRSSAQWSGLRGRPKLLVYRRSEMEDQAKPWIKQIVDEAYAGPRLELETDDLDSAVDELDAALAAMRPASVID